MRYVCEDLYIRDLKALVYFEAEDGCLQSIPGLAFSNLYNLRSITFGNHTFSSCTEVVFHSMNNDIDSLIRSS